MPETTNKKTYVWDDISMPRLGASLTRSENKFLHRGLHSVNGQTALDIGCGTGKHSKILDALGFSTTSIEYDFTPISLFKERNPNAKLAQADGQHLPFTDKAFNVVLAMQVQDYFTDRNSFYEEVWRVLKPGGLFILTMTNKHSIKGLIYERYLSWNNRKRTAAFYADSLSTCLEKLQQHPFSVEEMWGYNWNTLPRNCNNALLVNSWAAIEKVFRLEKFPYISPVVFVIARKNI